MSMIYIHIPFCKRKCLYCSFYSVTQHFDTHLYAKYIAQELHQNSDFLTDNKIKSLYFGGGTPSLLNINDIEIIIQSVKNNFDCSALKEITFEINPNIDKSYIQNLKDIGINRLSIGIQSFDDDELKFLNRNHTSKQACNTIEYAKQVGFTNISLDLIYGLPTEKSFEKYKKSLSIATTFKPTHLSCYQLTIEEGTMLQYLINKGKYKELEDEQILQQMDYTMDSLNDYGFEHYETSSYCQKGFASVQNTGYWTFEQYLGVGPSAHSYNGRQRKWIDNNIENYYIAFKNNTKIKEKYESLTVYDKYIEYIMLSSRLSKGFSNNYIQQKFPMYYDEFLKNRNKAIKYGFINENNSLTRKGFHQQNQIALCFI